MSKSFFLPGLILIIFIFFLSCNEEPSFLGKNILPSNNDIFFRIDSLTAIEGYTVGLDSVKISDKDVGLLGVYEDPIFGTSSAGFLVQLEPSDSAYYLEQSFTIDSIVLKLRYDDFLGANEQDNDFEVNEITEDLNRDLNYYSGSDFSLYYNEGLNIAEDIYYTSEIILGDVYIEDEYDDDDDGNLTEIIDTLFDQPIDTVDFINIALPNILAQKLLEADSVTFSSRDNFVNYFKGLNISPGVFNNTMYFMNYSPPDNSDRYSRIAISFQDTSAHTFSYIITEHSAQINIFDHDYTGYAIETSLNDTVTESDLLYIQGMTGASGLIKLDLNNWLDSVKIDPIAINKAELIIEPDFANYPYEDLFPESLRIFSLNENYDMFSPEYFEYISDGDLTVYDEDNDCYTINLTGHIQKILNGEINNDPLMLIAGSNTTSANRIVVKNGSNSDPMKLKIYYTKIKVND